MFVFSSVKKFLYNLTVPTSPNQDLRRQEFILKTMLVGLIALSGYAVLRTTYDSFTVPAEYSGTSPVILLVYMLVFVGLYSMARRQRIQLSAILLVSVLGASGVQSLVHWGINLPMGLLVIILSIILAGVLLNTKFALWLAAVYSAMLLVFGYLQSSGIVHPDFFWQQAAPSPGDAFGYVFVIGLITTLCWLSNRDIRMSLERAQKSERALQRERDLLEARVEERTKELEESQREKILQLYRFADFGRISAGLLHDIINPLTAVSLNLEQLSTKQRSDLVSQALDGIKYIEGFIQTARQQIQNPRHLTVFSAPSVIREVIRGLQAKAKAAHVEIKADLARPVKLYGNAFKFNQMIANLLVNAIDAYDGEPEGDRQVEISLREEATETIIEVKDRGHGISKANLKRIFEPFFTTKASDTGTGIGLVITRSVAEQDFAGRIEVVSDAATGTVFTVRIPRRA